MRATLLPTAVTVFVFALGLTVAGQTSPPRAGGDGAGSPTLEQMRRTVATLRGNRIATPNDYDALTPDQQAYVRSILSGPRASITGPLGVMMVSPALGDLTQKAAAYARFAGEPRLFQRATQVQRAGDPRRRQALVGRVRLERPSRLRRADGTAGGAGGSDPQRRAAAADGEGRGGDLHLRHRVHHHPPRQRRHLCRRPGPCSAATAAWSIWSGTMGLYQIPVHDGRARRDAARRRREALFHALIRGRRSRCPRATSETRSTALIGAPGTPPACRRSVQA